MTSRPRATLPSVAVRIPNRDNVIIRVDAPATGFIEMANMRPGAWATRTVNVLNGGRSAFDSYTLSIASVDAPTMLWTDPVNGLRLRIRRGTAVIYEGPIAVRILDLGATLAPGGTDALELSVYLPDEAGNAAQGQSQAVSITWTATGR